MKREGTRFGKEYIEERHTNPTHAMIVVNAAGFGIELMAGKADPFITKGIEHAAKLQEILIGVEKIVGQAAQGSKSISNLFDRLAKIKGAEFTFKVIRSYVPGVVNGTELVVGTAKSVVGVENAVLSAKDFLVKAAGALGFLRQALKFWGGFASSYSDNLGICNMTTGLIDQLEYFKVKSYFNEVPPNTAKRNSL